MKQLSICLYFTSFGVYSQKIENKHQLIDNYIYFIAKRTIHYEQFYLCKLDISELLLKLILILPENYTFLIFLYNNSVLLLSAISSKNSCVCDFT